MNIIAVATDEAPRSAGGHWGILAGLFGIYLVWRIDLWWRQRHGLDGDPSPTETAAPAPIETRRSGLSRLASHRETSHPRVEKIGHGGYVSYEGTPAPRRVVQTQSDGSRRHIEKVPAAYGDEPFGDELDEALLIASDAPLDAPVDDGTDDEEFDDDEPVDDEERVRESAEEYARRCFAAGVKKAAIVGALQEHYDMKRATAYRLVGRIEGPART